MYRPFLVTAPTVDVVTLEEAKAHLRVDFSEDDDLIKSLIAAAVGHLEGWTGILGRVLAEQTWRQDFDRFDRCMIIPLGPVLSIESIAWRDLAGQVSTVDAAWYERVADAGGREIVRFVDGFSLPTDLARSAAVSITYKAGYPTVDGKATVPAPIKTAILMLVAGWYEHREAVTEGERVPLPFAVEALISPYRRYAI